LTKFLSGGWVKVFVGVTDNNWFKFLSSLPDVDEVNFWRMTDESMRS
jgi:hypothetical protein